MIDPAAFAVTHTICALSDLEDPGSRAFSIGADPWPLRGFLVRVGEQVFAYVNRCPHAGHPLNFRPDEFLTQDKTTIICRSHGATFERTTGRCITGPCFGESLHALRARVEAGLVVLDGDRELASLV
jgi:nitrite reductase/ring-hydroxylating ferredoxin subunit